MIERKAAIERIEDAIDMGNLVSLIDYEFMADVCELLRIKTPWTLTKERLPEAKEGFFGTPYIVLTKSGTVIPLWYVEKIIRETWVRRWEYYGGHIYHGEVIAWAPMPEPPKGALLNE